MSEEEGLDKTLSGESAPAAEEKPKRSFKGIVFGAVFSLICIAVLLTVLLQLGDIEAVFQAIGEADGMFIMYALLVLLAYILLWPLAFCVLCRTKKTKTSFTENYLIGATEHFFNGITPFQTGAQPFQIYSLARGNVKAGDGTGLVLANFIATCIASNLLVALSFIYAPTLFSHFDAATLWIPILGLFMNFFTLVSFICITTCKWFRNFIVWCMRLVCKIKIVNRFLGKRIPAFEAYCDRTQEAAKSAFANIPSFIVTVLIKIVCTMLYYTIPFFLLKALNFNFVSGDFMYVFFATCFVINSVVFVPTPGGSGGMEFAFTVVFLAAAISDNQVFAAALLWRGFTYYLLMLVSFIQYLALELIYKVKANKIKKLEMPV